MKHIGLFGGTFNPIHLGHLAVAKAVFSNVHLNEILFLPAAVPPHKSNFIIPFEIRLEMIEIALENDPYFFVSDYDYRNEKPTYTDELIKRLKIAFPNHKYYFIIGEDNVINLQTWNQSEWLLNNLEFIVVTRPNVDKSQWKNLPYIKKLTFIDMEPVPISSTKIRNALKKNKSLEQFVDPKIIPFIEKYKSILMGAK